MKKYIDNSYPKIIAINNKGRLYSLMNASNYFRSFTFVYFELSRFILKFCFAIQLYIIIKSYIFQINNDDPTSFNKASVIITAQITILEVLLKTR